MTAVGPPLGMASRTEYKVEFCRRVKEAREDRGLTQEEMAELLGVGPSLYPKYENRSMLPHYLVPRFCNATGVEIGWLFTGRPPKRRGNRAGTMSPAAA